MQSKSYVSFLAVAAIAASLIIAVPVFAQANPGFGKGTAKGGQMQRPGVVGTVSAINGNTLTVTSKARTIGATATTAKTYTVDASNATVTKNGATSSVSNIAVGDTIMVQGTVSGTNVTAKTIRDGVMAGTVRAGMGISGTVASISGTTITVTSKARTIGATATTAKTYTVDASNATVTKNGATSSVSNIAVGDTIMVQGTVTGNNVVAKTIRDGLVPSPASAIQGNGQPVVAGSVTAVSGNIITITNKSNVTYTVDATNAKFVETGVASPTISNVATGDNVVVQGTVNGTSITASSVIDQKAKVAGNSSNAGGNNKPATGIMGGIMNFFKNLFGF